jgi:hypothetical protein
MESNSSILKHRGKNYSLKEIESIEIDLTDFERKVIDSRLSGLSFGQIEENNLRWHIDQIMLRGAAISGCVVPATEFFAEIIAEEISVFILEFGYRDLSYDEILLALRINSKGGYKLPTGIELESVPFFGNCFNVDYLSKILLNYMAIRNILDRKLQNIIDGYK